MTVAAAPVLAGLDTKAPAPTSAGLTAAIDGLLGQPSLAHVTASVVDVSTGRELYNKNGANPATPASSQKLLTAAAVLYMRGPEYRIPTRVVAGSQPGEVVLVAGGDLTLSAGADGYYAGAGRLDLLASQVKSALGGTAPTKVIIDQSVFQGPPLPPEGVWFGADVTSGTVARITPLMINGARTSLKHVVHGTPKRSAQPDQAAAAEFAKALGLPASAVTTGTATAGAKQLGEVFSPPLSRLVETMLLESDNVLAEGLARQVALAKNMPASFDGAAAATKQVLTELGLPASGITLVDGSGLSWNNRVTASLLAAVLVKASSPDQPKLRSILSGLPVAGYSGTLDDRFDTNGTGPAVGIARAKTGTLSGVNAMAGTIVDNDGRLLAFAVVANQVPSGQGASDAAENALDRVAAALAGCGCS
jgi:D-alanyl-D-alanine carboxypeptidase/D-alanyl-D-alanine-endopeptidase (penicillin-binding protein 4)